MEQPSDLHNEITCVTFVSFEYDVEGQILGTSVPGATWENKVNKTARHRIANILQIY